MAMDESGSFILEASITNNGTTQISAYDVLPSEYAATYYLYGTPNGANSNGMMGWNGERDIPPNATATVTSTILASMTAEPETEKTLNIFGAVIGAYCFEMNGSEYYIDLSEYITK